MHDSFFQSNLPWSSGSIKAHMLKFILLDQYCLWIVLDTDKRFKIVADCIALILQGTIMLMRIKLPTFEFELV